MTAISVSLVYRIAYFARRAPQCAGVVCGLCVTGCQLVMVVDCTPESVVMASQARACGWEA